MALVQDARVAASRAVGRAWRRMGRAFAALAATAVLLSGCGGASPSAAGPDSAAPAPSVAVAATSAPSPTPTASPTPTPAPTPMPPAAALCTPDIVEGCPLSAGTYAADPFEPRFRFTVGSGWTNYVSSPAVGSIRQGEATGLSWGTDLRAEDGTDISTSSSALFAFLRSHPGTTPLEPVPVTIGGMPGESIDLTVDSEVMFTVGPAGARPWGLAPGFMVRAIAVDVGGIVVVFMIEVTPADAFDVEMAAVQPILDSIIWE